jgi:hypothetical protein
VVEGLSNLGRTLVTLFASLAGFLMVMMMGWKFLVIMAHGGNERKVREEAVSLIVMSVAFAGLMSLAGAMGAPLVDSLPGPARVAVSVGKMIWDAIFAAFSGATG